MECNNSISTVIKVNALLLQLMATLPFQIICALVFSFTLYGMANLKRSGVVLLEHGILVTLLYLIAVQVRHRKHKHVYCSITVYSVSLRETTAQPSYIAVQVRH